MEMSEAQRSTPPERPERTKERPRGTPRPPTPKSVTDDVDAWLGLGAASAEPKSLEVSPSVQSRFDEDLRNSARLPEVRSRFDDDLNSSARLPLKLNDLVPIVDSPSSRSSEGNCGSWRVSDVGGLSKGTCKPLDERAKVEEVFVGSEVSARLCFPIDGGRELSAPLSRPAPPCRLTPSGSALVSCSKSNDGSAESGAMVGSWMWLKPIDEAGAPEVAMRGMAGRTAGGVAARGALASGMSQVLQLCAGFDMPGGSGRTPCKPVRSPMDICAPWFCRLAGGSSILWPSVRVLRWFSASPGVAHVIRPSLCHCGSSCAPAGMPGIWRPDEGAAASGPWAS
mmetsp:Transcript_25350/g.64401  ORF Transcript_25350/g.64401 Transcript_25350/m.64401 type:complete len:339 (+) Transcript_25350:652-1668(+)